MTVTTKNAKNGARLYYVDSKRVSRQIALEVAAQNRAGNPFVIEYDTEQTHFFVNAPSKKFVYTSRDTYTELDTRIDNYKGYTLYIGTHEIHTFYDKNPAKELLAQIEDAFINGEHGIKVTLDGTIGILPDAEPELPTNPDATGGEPEITQAEKIAALEYEIECIINKRQDRLDELEDAEANDDIAQFVIDQLKNEIDALTDEYWKYVRELEELQKSNVPDTDSDTPAEIDAAEYAITEDAFNFAVEYEIEEAAIVAGEARAIARILANETLKIRYDKAKTQVKYERYENGYCGWYFKGKHSDKWECNVTKATACLTRYGLSRFEFAILSENEPAVIDNNGYDESAFELLPTVDELNDADTGLPLADGEVEGMGDAQAILVATFIDGTSEGKCFETADAAIAFARKCEKDSLIKRGYVMGDNKHYGNEIIYEFNKRTQAILNDDDGEIGTNVDIRGFTDEDFLSELTVKLDINAAVEKILATADNFRYLAQRHEITLTKPDSEVIWESDFRGYKDGKSFLVTEIYNHPNGTLREVLVRKNELSALPVITVQIEQAIDTSEKIVATEIKPTAGNSEFADKMATLTAELDSAQSVYNETCKACEIKHEEYRQAPEVDEMTA